MTGCFALSCPKNFSAQSDPVLFCASDNKRLELVCVYLHDVCVCTFMIWSPVRSPSSSAGLSSWTPAMKMPTSFPPASLRPTLSPFWKITITVLGLDTHTRARYTTTHTDHEGRSHKYSTSYNHTHTHTPVNLLVLQTGLQQGLGCSTQFGSNSYDRCCGGKYNNISPSLYYVKLQKTM